MKIVQESSLMVTGNVEGYPPPHRNTLLVTSLTQFCSYFYQHLHSCFYSSELVQSFISSSWYWQCNKFHLCSSLHYLIVLPRPQLHSFIHIYIKLPTHPLFPKCPPVGPCLTVPVQFDTLIVSIRLTLLIIELILYLLWHFSSFVQSCYVVLVKPSHKLLNDFLSGLIQIQQKKGKVVWR